MTNTNEGDGATLIVRDDGAIRILTLDRPGVLNALDTQTMRDLLAAVRHAAEDDAVRCVVLTGANGAFCAGGDTRAIAAAAKARAASFPATGAAQRPGFERRLRWLRRSADTSRLLHEMPKPTIAMIGGACAGAGMSLAAACDFRIAGASARFRSAFVAGGVSGDYGGSWLWTRILGPAKARRLYLIDEKRSAAEALAFGLVDEVSADEALEARVMDLARQLATTPGTAVAQAKATLNAAMDEGFGASLDRESLAMLLSRDALIAERKAAS